MPKFEKLPKEEVAKILMKKQQSQGVSKRKQILQKYMEQLKDLEVGEGLEVKISKDENRQTVKNRLLRAAERLGIEIEFIRSRGVIRLYRTK